MKRHKNRSNGHGSDDVKLGSCCVCESLVGVRNILMLNQKSPVPGHGWGCFQCGLPPDGASAVLCDDCFSAILEKPLRFACVGYPAKDGRIPIEQLSEAHEHDYTKHSEAWWFNDSPDVGHADCICSICRKQINEGEVPLRIFEGELEARFHDDCLKKVQHAKGFFQ